MLGKVYLAVELDWGARRRRGYDARKCGGGMMRAGMVGMMRGGGAGMVGYVGARRWRERSGQVGVVARRRNRETEFRDRSGGEERRERGTQLVP